MFPVLIMDYAKLPKKASWLPANRSTMGAVVPCASGDDLSSWSEMSVSNPEEQPASSSNGPRRSKRAAQPNRRFINNEWA